MEKWLIPWIQARKISNEPGHPFCQKAVLNPKNRKIGDKSHKTYSARYGQFKDQNNGELAFLE